MTPPCDEGRPGERAALNVNNGDKFSLLHWTPAHTCNTCPTPHHCRCTPTTLDRLRPARPGPCGWCGASAGERCYRVAPGRRMVRLEAGFHPSRLEAVAA